MLYTEIKSCYVGPAISPEQFVPEHFFLFLAKGKINAYDGSRHYHLLPGEYCLVRKNRLGRYNKQKEDGAFEKVVVLFEESFLKEFQIKYNIQITSSLATDTFIRLRNNPAIPDFVFTLASYYIAEKPVTKEMEQQSKEELLLLLLHGQPELSAILFDYGMPGKINLEEFMNRNFRFNVSLERFAYLTGRSLSAFKRDFRQIFDQTPSRWLVRRRLEEAHFLLTEKSLKSNDIYLDLGFEDLSHFSFSFKKQFGRYPTEALV